LILARARNIATSGTNSDKSLAQMLPINAPAKDAPTARNQKKLLDFFDAGMLQRLDFELRPYRSNDSI
jgi:hypothetical protein